MKYLAKRVWDLAAAPGEALRRLARKRRNM